MYRLSLPAFDRDAPGIPAGRVNSGRTGLGPVTTTLEFGVVALKGCAIAGPMAAKAARPETTARACVTHESFVIATVLFTGRLSHQRLDW